MESLETSRMTFEEYLARYGTMTYKNRGVSMLPLLRQGQDTFTLKKKGEERCRKYDVVLFHRGDGRYVLHRVVKVRADDYVILGDNCIRKEYGIRDDEILGIMTGYRRNGKDHTVEEFGYKLYSRIRYAFYPLRSRWQILKGKAGNLLRKVGLRGKK